MVKGVKEIEYDFDVHPPRSYYRFFVSQYLEAVYRALKKIPTSLSKKTIFEIGMGRGRTLPLFEALGVEKVVGFDLYPDEAAYAQKKAKKLNLPLEIIIDTPNNKKLQSTKSNSADCVAVIYLLCFVPKNRFDFILTEAKRILKPKGVLIVLDMPKPSLMWLLNTVTFKHRNFIAIEEWVGKLKPFKILAEAEANYFYIFNALGDLLGLIGGTRLFNFFNNTARSLRIPASCKLYIAQKP